LICGDDHWSPPFLKRFHSSPAKVLGDAGAVSDPVGRSKISEEISYQASLGVDFQLHGSSAFPLHADDLLGIFVRVRVTNSMSGVTKFFIFISWLVWMPTASVIAAEEQAAKVEKKPELPANNESAVVDPDDAEAAEEADAAKAAMAMPVSPELVRVYGWREDIEVKGFPHKLEAKLDSGALTSSIHAEQKEYFERDGKKWIRFLVKDIRKGKKISGRIEAPMVRMAKIKEPGAASVSREVVLLSFRLGDRKFRGEFTLNNRGNMISPVLIGRSIIRDLGWVDVSRTHLAEQNILR
jgi:hypothetical protein